MHGYMTCIHQQEGLCPDCQAEYDADPQGWIDYGFHAAGERRWASLQAEMDEWAIAARIQAEMGRQEGPDPDLPF